MSLPAPAIPGPPGGVASIADVEAIEAVPLEQRDLPASTYAMIAAGAAISPASPALSFFLEASGFRDPAVWSHEDLLRDIHRASNALRDLGVQRGDVVAFALPNLPETHLVIWGAETAGIAFAINPLLDSTQIRQLLTSGRASWLVTLAPTPGTDVWERATAAAVGVPGLRGILAVNVARYLPEPARSHVSALAASASLPAGAPPVHDFGLLLADARADRLEFEPPAADDVSSYVCTGGTTGVPKIARRTHRAEVFDAWAVQPLVPDAFAPQHAVFCGLPLFHVNAQLVTGLTPWSRGAHVVLGTGQGYRGEGVISSFWAIAEHYRLVAFSGVPTVFAGLLQQPVAGHDITSIEYGICGAAPMPEELFRAFERTTGIRVLEAYGLTEGSCASSVNPAGATPRVGSIGIRLPYQRMAAAVLDSTGRFVRFARADETGALMISGPNVFDGYVDPEHERGIWVDADGRRWLDTGDIARQDADGYFWLTGRKKELIIRGGHNIDPKSIEEPMHEHPAVALAAAIGRPDAHAGEVPVVYVQRVPQSTATEAELLAFAADRIGERAARPKHVRILTQLPTTSVGKIFKPALTMLEIEDVVRTVADACGATLVSVAVVQDPSRGLLATVTADGDVAALRTELGRFAFRSEVVPA